jgi:hypothetical protein
MLVDGELEQSFLQKENGVRCPVMFTSRPLLDRERAYSISEKECLGVVHATDRFNRYLCGEPFILETDNKPLEVLNRAECSNPQIMRW